ncbi:protein kinase [Myxococcus sp. CA039A]|uniref:serine/threonine protein kinase n=1 Tax=Myxococcus sp. CA039A TaxID=2741737 RepID=UPI00157AFC0F|nr:protein kinase [Myxococcus sp. CA039A]NTX57532.1 protein kinase [Myxococcus sp. CA039A]
MSDDSDPRLTEGVVLFSQGDTTYFLFQILGEGRNGERILYARPRTPEGLQGKVLVKYVALPKGEGISEKHQRARIRLEEEVRLARFLQHPSIARVHGLFEMKQALCVASECVDGFTLDSLLAIAQARGRYFSEAFVLHVFAEVAAALAYAHERTDDAGIPLGIVNRDVNPTRIRLTPQGGVKLTDFGVAFSRLAGRVATSLPRPKGDVIYSSPELLLGEEVDRRADLFSLGLTMLEFATGRHLYDPGNLKLSDLEARMSEEERRRVLKATVRSMDAGLTSVAEDAICWAMAYRPLDVDVAVLGVPEPLRAILRKLFHRKPSDRFETAADLEGALRIRLDDLGPYGPDDAVNEVQQALTDAGDAMEELNLLDDEGGFIPADWRAHPDHVETQPEARNEDELTTDPRPGARRAVKAPPAA